MKFGLMGKKIAACGALKGAADNDDSEEEEDVEDDDEWEAEFMKDVDSLLEHDMEHEE